MLGKQHAGSHKQTSNHKKAKPDLNRLTRAQADSAQREAQTDPGVYGNAFTEERLGGAQRRSLASHAGRVLGNQQLQRMVASARGGNACQPAPSSQAVARLSKAGLLAHRLQGSMALQAKNGDKKAAPKTPLELLREELRAGLLVDKPACLRYIAQLGPQAATVRNDVWLMSSMADVFNAREMLLAVRRLSMELKWAVYWLRRAREATAVGSKGYDTLIAASPARQAAELIGWNDMLDVVKTNRPGNPLTMFPPLIANNPMLAHVFGAYGHFVDWILQSAGGQQLLHFLLRHTPAAMIRALDKSHRWTPFIKKLPKGAGLAPPDKTGLHTLAGKSPDARHQADLFEVRFNVLTRQTGSVAWESKGLMRAWQLLTVLPVSDVEGNPKLSLFLRAGKGGTMGESDMTKYVKYWYNANKLGELDIKSYTDPTDPMNRMNIFDLTIIHEVGHAVDGAFKFSDSYCKTKPGGGWKKHTPKEAVDAMITASPWRISLPKSWGLTATPGKAKTWQDWVRVGLKFLTEIEVEANARKACIDAAAKRHKVRDEAKAIDPKGNLWKMIRGQRVVRAIEPAFVSNEPWMNHGKQVKFGDRYYHEGYKGLWVSYLSDRYDVKLSKYQFRDPRDWFAEVYACYYGTVNPSAPRSEDAGTKVPEPIKTWFRTHVAKTVPPPGAKKAGP